MASFAGIDINSYRSQSAQKAQKDAQRNTKNRGNGGGGESIGAWRGASNTSQPASRGGGGGSSPRAKESLLRDVDRFVNTMPRASKYSVEQTDAASRLYRSELARDESQAKLNEWMKVASELQEVVQQQQRQLDATARRTKDVSPTNATARQTRPSSSVSPHIAQLQNLVQSVRAELERPSRGPSPVAGDGPTNSSTSSPASSSDADATRLQSEIQALRLQLQQLQHSQQRDDRIVEEESNALTAKMEAQRRATAEARAEQERTRAALLDAEMELQKSAAELSTVRQQLSEGESARLAQARQLAAAQAELELAVNRAEAAEQQAEAAQREREAAMQRASEAVSESGRLQATCSQKDGNVYAAQRAAEMASIELAAAEAKVASAEASAAIERSKCGSMEASVARLQSEILQMEGELAEVTRRAKAEAATASAQMEALQDELTAVQREARVARREADSSRGQIDTLQQAHAGAVAAAKAAQEKCLELEAEKEAALRRATHAEAHVSAAVAAAAERDAAGEAERTLRHETEIRALKEVLDRVAAAAQQKDASLLQLAAEHAQLHTMVQASERRLMEVQVAAAAESKQWEAQLAAAAAATTAAAGVAQISVDPPVVLNITVQDAPEWHEGDPIPSPLQRRLDVEMERAKDVAEEIIEVELARERREHMAAVRDLEEAHSEALAAAVEAEAKRAARAQQENAAPPSPEGPASYEGASAIRRGWEAAEAESAALREEVVVLRERAQSAQTRLHAAETELLSAQDNAARLNSVVIKLQEKCKKYKDSMLEARIELAEVKKEAELSTQRADAAEAEIVAANAELADAQDEVEALLTARINTLSRAPSEADMNDYQDEEEEEREEQQQQHYEEEMERLNTLPPGAPLYEAAQDYSTHVDTRGLSLAGPLGQASLSFTSAQRAVMPVNYVPWNEAEQQEEGVPEVRVAPPVRQSRSPLKKLASLIRGKRGSRGAARAIDAPVAAAPVVARDLGRVSSTLRRGADGTVEWRPNTVAAAHDAYDGGDQVRSGGYREIERDGRDDWRGNDLYVDHSNQELEY